MNKIGFLLSLLLMLYSCDYLDVVPDNIATIDNAFANEITTERYLLTCYAGLPTESDTYSNPAILSGDEYWSWEAMIGYTEESTLYYPWMIARGNQNTNSPYVNMYEGGLWQTIRKCNTFIENVKAVPGLRDMDIKRWTAEAKVIKAYCHFYLMRMYGPIPIIKESLDISADPEAVKFEREPWEKCVDYVVQLLDEALNDLPLKIANRQEELGRMTQPIVATLKAKVLVTSASPLFNGNSYYTDFMNRDGTLLFSDYDPQKWVVAKDACQKAIEICHEAGLKLYEYSGGLQLTDMQRMEYTIRGGVTNKEWSDDLIWGSVKSPGAIQKYVQAYLDPDLYQVGGHIHQALNVPLKIAKQFYTINGVPIEEDITWENKDLEKLRAATLEEGDVIKGTTAELNFEREPRFYASLGFDRGVWYGSGRTVENPFVLQGLKNQTGNTGGSERVNVTGYWAKKMVNLESYQNTKTSYVAIAYPWPILRLSDLYLLYAETLNEVEGPTGDVYKYVNLVRERAGLGTVQDCWSKYSKMSSKYQNKDGMREIIQRERLIELAFEGQRFWDLRRWLLCGEYYETPISGWNYKQESAEDYYKETFIYMQSFTAKDYLWPISQSLLTKNPNLVQTKGW